MAMNFYMGDELSSEKLIFIREINFIAMRYFHQNNIINQDDDFHMIDETMLFIRDDFCMSDEFSSK